MTGIGQTTGKIQEQHADDMQCDLMEITAHVGARPAHALWQGKIVSRSGKKGYLTLDDIGYGTGSGFKGWNCRHDWFPFFEGISERTYNENDLKKLEDEKVTYNNKEYSLYEATQIQRQAERQIRAIKRELASYQSIIENTDTESLKNQAKTKFNINSIKLKNQQDKLKDFINQTELTRDRYREKVNVFDKVLGKKSEKISKSIIENTKKYDIIDIDNIKIDEITNDGMIGLLKSYNTALNHGLSTNTETLLNIDKTTGLEVVKQLNGEKASVRLTNESMEILNNLPKNSVISIHNHPGSSSFSSSDIKVMLSFDSISDITVIGHNNVIYTLNIAEGQRPALYNIDYDYNYFKKEKFDFYRNKVINKEITKEQAWYEQSNCIVEKIAQKYGWKYRRYKL